MQTTKTSDLAEEDLQNIISRMKILLESGCVNQPDRPIQEKECRRVLELTLSDLIDDQPEIQPCMVVLEFHPEGIWKLDKINCEKEPTTSRVIHYSNGWRRVEISCSMLIGQRNAPLHEEKIKTWSGCKLPLGGDTWIHANKECMIAEHVNSIHVQQILQYQKQWGFFVPLSHKGNPGILYYKVRYDPVNQLIELFKKEIFPSVSSHEAFKETVRSLAKDCLSIPVFTNDLTEFGVVNSLGENFNVLHGFSLRYPVGIWGLKQCLDSHYHKLDEKQRMLAMLVVLYTAWISSTYFKQISPAFLTTVRGNETAFVTTVARDNQMRNLKSIIGLESWYLYNSDECSVKVDSCPLEKETIVTQMLIPVSARIWEFECRPGIRFDLTPLFMGNLSNVPRLLTCKDYKKSLMLRDSQGENFVEDSQIKVVNTNTKGPRLVINVSHLPDICDDNKGFKGLERGIWPPPLSSTKRAPSSLHEIYACVVGYGRGTAYHEDDNVRNFIPAFNVANMTVKDLLDSLEECSKTAKPGKEKKED